MVKQEEAKLSFLHHQPYFTSLKQKIWLVSFKMNVCFCCSSTFFFSIIYNIFSSWKKKHKYQSHESQKNHKRAVISKNLTLCSLFSCQCNATKFEKKKEHHAKSGMFLYLMLCNARVNWNNKKEDLLSGRIIMSMELCKKNF